MLDQMDACVTPHGFNEHAPFVCEQAHDLQHLGKEVIVDKHVILGSLLLC